MIFTFKWSLTGLALVLFCIQQQSEVQAACQTVPFNSSEEIIVNYTAIVRKSVKNHIAPAMLRVTELILPTECIEFIASDVCTTLDSIHWDVYNFSGLLVFDFKSCVSASNISVQYRDVLLRPIAHNINVVTIKNNFNAMFSNVSLAFNNVTVDGSFPAKHMVSLMQHNDGTSTFAARFVNCNFLLTSTVVDAHGLNVSVKMYSSHVVVYGGPVMDLTALRWRFWVVSSRIECHPCVALESSAISDRDCGNGYSFGMSFAGTGEFVLRNASLKISFKIRKQPITRELRFIKFDFHRDTNLQISIDNTTVDMNATDSAAFVFIAPQASSWLSFLNVSVFSSTFYLTDVGAAESTSRGVHVIDVAKRGDSHGALSSVDALVLRVVFEKVSLFFLVETSVKQQIRASVMTLRESISGSHIDIRNVTITADIRNGTYLSLVAVVGEIETAIVSTDDGATLRNSTVLFTDCTLTAHLGASFGPLVKYGIFTTVVAIWINRLALVNVTLLVATCAVVLQSYEFQSIPVQQPSALKCNGLFPDPIVLGSNLTAVIVVFSNNASAAGLGCLNQFIAGRSSNFLANVNATNITVTISTVWNINAINDVSSNINTIVYISDALHHSHVSILGSGSPNATLPLTSAVVCSGCSWNSAHLLLHNVSHISALIAFDKRDSVLTSVNVTLRASFVRSALTPNNYSLFSTTTPSKTASLTQLTANIEDSNVSNIRFAAAVVRWYQSSVYATCSWWNNRPLRLPVLREYTNTMSGTSGLSVNATCATWPPQSDAPSDIAHFARSTSGNSPEASLLVGVGVTSALTQIIASSSGMSIRRLTLAPLCSGLVSALEAPVDVTNDPLRLRFGPTAGAAHRGAVVGNTVFVLAAALCALVAVRVLHRVKRGAVCMSGCAALLQLPGALMIVVGLLYQQVMASSVLLLWSAAQSEVDGVGAADAVVGACGCALCAGVLAALVRVLLLRFEARGLPAAAVPYAARWQAVLAYWVADRVQWLPQRGGKRQSADGGARWFVGCYGRLFRGCCARREWWLAGDVCVTMVLSVVSGFVPTTAAGCLAEEWVFVVVTGAWLVATVVLRPKHRRLVLVKDVASNGGQFVLAMCRALHAPQALLDVLTWCTVVSCLLLTVVVLAGQRLLLAGSSVEPLQCAGLKMHEGGSAFQARRSTNATGGHDGGDAVVSTPRRGIDASCESVLRELVVSICISRADTRSAA